MHPRPGVGVRAVPASRGGAGFSWAGDRRLAECRGLRTALSPKRNGLAMASDGGAGIGETGERSQGQLLLGAEAEAVACAAGSRVGSGAAPAGPGCSLS